MEEQKVRNIWRIAALALLWPVALYVIVTVLDRYDLSFWRTSKTAANISLALLFFLNPAIGIATIATVFTLWRRGVKDLKNHNLHRALWLAFLNIAMPVLLIVAYVVCCFVR
jgi:hypothetical protein